MDDSCGSSIVSFSSMSWLFPRPPLNALCAVSRSFYGLSLFWRCLLQAARIPGLSWSLCFNQTRSFGSLRGFEGGLRSLFVVSVVACTVVDLGRAFCCLRCHCHCIVGEPDAFGRTLSLQSYVDRDRHKQRCGQIRCPESSCSRAKRAPSI